MRSALQEVASEEASVLAVEAMVASMTWAVALQEDESNLVNWRESSSQERVSLKAYLGAHWETRAPAVLPGKEA